MWKIVKSLIEFNYYVLRIFGSVFLAYRIFWMMVYCASK